MKVNDLPQRIERIKREMEFDTYMETILWLQEHETDVEMEEIAKNLNQKIIDNLRDEAINSNMLKMAPKRSIMESLTMGAEQ